MQSLKNKIAVITGGASGLGKALTEQLIARKCKVFIIDKHKRALLAMQQTYPEVIIIHADVSRVAGREMSYHHLQSVKINYLIHNAAIVAPIVPLAQLTLKGWRKLQATNVEGPLFLTQLLVPKLKLNARILHISSDCAHEAFAHWIAYCTAKAALNMLYQCLKKEFLNKRIHIGSVDPGMMATPMQRYICQLDFPEKMSFEELKDRNLIFAPEESAKFCLQVLLDKDDGDFSAEEWCYRGNEDDKL